MTITEPTNHLVPLNNPTTKPGASLSPRQVQSILEADAPVNIWHGSVRSGKTLASILAWLNFIRQAPPGRLFMIGKTLQTLERNVIDEMAAYFPARLAGDAVQHTNGAGTARILGREVHTIGANDARAEGRIRGATAAGAYVDELTLLPNEAYWLQLINRLSVDGARLFGTTNPDNPTHWLKTGPIDHAAERGYRVWHFTLDDNPALAPSYVERIKLENTGLWYQRNVEGRWVLAQGAIYDMFNPDPGRAQVATSRPTPGEVERWAIAVDYGTAGVFTAGLIALCEARIQCCWEWRWDARTERRQLTDAEYSARLRAWLTECSVEWGAPIDPDHVDVDPSATSFILQLRQDGWRNVRLADNTVADGIRSTAALFAAELLEVHESCKAGIAEVTGYVWDDTAAEKGEDRPVKRADHFPDMLRYGVMGLHRWWRWWLTDRPAEAA